MIPPTWLLDHRATWSQDAGGLVHARIAPSVAPPNVGSAAACRLPQKNTKNP